MTPVAVYETTGVKVVGVNVLSPGSDNPYNLGNIRTGAR
jgi:hypothetical protein